MEELAKHLVAVKKAYDLGKEPLSGVRAITEYCLEKLRTQAGMKKQPSLEGKAYVILTFKAGLSRPVLPSLFISDPTKFRSLWNAMVAGISPEQSKILISGKTEAETQVIVNQVIYTAVMALACCIDIWKPTSRKTPGTFFEVVLGSILTDLLPNHVRSKHVPLVGTEESVSTDIVFNSKDKVGLIFPAKITTRERIVQPFAHQRILDSYFGDDRYRSIITCISETQRDDVKNRVNDICVPGTIKLFQQHLASIDYLCYADPPTRYLQKDMTDFIAVKTLGWLLAEGLPLIAG